MNTRSVCSFDCVGPNAGRLVRVLNGDNTRGVIIFQRISTKLFVTFKMLVIRRLVANLYGKYSLYSFAASTVLQCRQTPQFSFLRRPRPLLYSTNHRSNM